MGDACYPSSSNNRFAPAGYQRPLSTIVAIKIHSRRRRIATRHHRINHPASHQLRKSGKKADGGGKEILWLDCLGNENFFGLTGTMCRFRSLKLKPDAPSYTTKSIRGRLVRTENARDVEYIECEVIDNNKHITYLEKEINKLKHIRRKNKQAIQRLHMQIELD
jgi:hypothetical protein